MELGERTERGRQDGILDKLDNDFAELVEAVESGGVDQLTPDQKVVLWQRFETFRNRLPLVDHHLIADAEATDLAETYCSATLIRFLVQVLQLSQVKPPRVRAAAAVGPEVRCWGNNEPVLPRLAALQRAGWCQ